jgi:hypothetical protein
MLHLSGVDSASTANHSCRVKAHLVHPKAPLSPPLYFPPVEPTIQTGLSFYTGILGGLTMFDSLSDRQDEQIGAHKLERFLRWGLVAIISLSLFGGLYLVVQTLE